MQTLETLFHEVTRNDHPSVNEIDKIALFEILASATCSLDLCPTVERPTKYYFPPSNPTKEIKTQITPGALQLVLSMESPKMSMNVEVTKTLLHAFNSNVELVLTQYTNSVNIVVKDDPSVTISLVFQGDITEIVVANSKNIEQTQLKQSCSKIIKAIQDMMDKKSKYLSGIRYHFAISCVNDPLNKFIAFNAYRKRHILPSYTLCNECTTAYSEMKAINKAWNVALDDAS